MTFGSGHRRQGRETMKNLFLESHGLRTPLTAIRWACGRLRKEVSGALTPDQRMLVGHIAANAKTLTTALESMFLLAKLEERSHAHAERDVCLPSLLESVREKLAAPPLHLRLRSLHQHVTADQEVLETLLRDILTIFLETPVDRERNVSVDIEAEEKSFRVTFRSSFLLPTLQMQEKASKSGEDRRLIGGIPGLMLSMAEHLAEALGGTLELQEIITGEFVADGTVELPEHMADEYRIVITLPLATKDAEGTCSFCMQDA